MGAQAFVALMAGAAVDGWMAAIAPTNRLAVVVAARGAQPFESAGAAVTPPWRDRRQ